MSDVGAVLLGLAVVVTAVRAAGWLAGRWGQPRVVGEIVAGVLLGPSVLGALLPGVAALLLPAGVRDALGVLGQCGLVLFMLLVGRDIDPGVLRARPRAALSIVPATVLVPMGVGAGVALLIPGGDGGTGGRPAFTLFVAAAMAVTALPVLARLLQDAGLLTSRIGSLALTCAAASDVVAWLVVAGVATTVGGGGDVLRSVLLAGLYVVVVLGPVRAVLHRLPTLPLWAVVVLAALGAWAADGAGVHVAFGGLLVGVALPRDAAWRVTVDHQLGGVVATVLLPLFFAGVGLSVHLQALGTSSAALALVLVVAAAVAGKYGGSALAARAAGESWPDALRLGALMNARGVTEIVVLSVGLQLGVLSPDLFTVMVVMAVLTTAMTAPLLRVADRRRTAPATPKGVQA